jgi:hypothetical protein
MEKSNVYNFLKDLFDILQTKKPKKNCLHIISLLNGGKNYFCNTNFHLKSIDNFNKHLSFSLQETT